MEGGLTSEVIAWLSGHIHWLGPAIFCVSMLESLAIAGIVVPGVALLFAAAALAGSAELGIAGVLAWAFAGAVVGDMTSFALGRIFHQDIRRLGLFRKHPDWIDRGESFFRRYGMLSVLIGRFVGPIRPIIPLVAGMFDMPVWRFAAINIFSALLWAPVYLLPGYLTGHALNWDVPVFFWRQTLGVLGGLAALGLLALLAFRTQARWTPLAAASLSLVGMVALSVAAPWLSVFDATVAGWIQHSEPSPSATVQWLRRLIAPLDEPFFLMLLLAGLTTLLLAGRGWRQWVFVALTVATCLAIAWLPGVAERSSPVALAVALVLATAVLCNREQSFWRRMAWALYCAIPIGAILGAALASLSPLLALAALLQATFAASLALWLVGRGAPIPAPATWLGVSLACWPGIAAALALLSAPG